MPDEFREIVSKDIKVFSHGASIVRPYQVEDQYS